MLTFIKQKNNAILFVLLISFISIQKVYSQQLHLNCSQEAIKFNWDRTPTNNSEFNWVDGNLTNTLNNISNSGVDITVSFSGNTNTLDRWRNSSTTTDSPAIGLDANGEDNLQYYTNGFNSEEGITIEIDFSTPVYAVGFDLMHINTSGQNGDKYIVTANTTNNTKIYPIFTKSNAPTYTFNNATGEVDATQNITNENARIGVNFVDDNKIKSITIVWKDCNTCTTGAFHGSGISGLSFCKNVPNIGLDSDNDGVADINDLDDDNDGITDAFEICGENFQQILNAPKNFNVYIDLDEYENETTWSLTGPNSFSESGGPYSANNEIINQNIAITTPGRYTFIIRDSFGDGLSLNGNSDSNQRSEYRISLDDTVLFQSSLSPNFGRGRGFFIDVPVDEVKFPCLATDPSLDDDNDGIINYKDNNYNTNVSGDAINSFGIWSSLDLDADGIPNYLDLDSDGDGCPDTIESSVPNTMLEAEIINNTPTSLLLTKNAVLKGPFGNNGYANILENRDDIGSIPNFQNSYTIYTINNSISACGTAMITQVTQSNNNRFIEITNIHDSAIIPANAIKLSLFNNSSGSQTNKLPNFTVTNTSILNPGESLLFKNSNSSLNNTIGTTISSNGITNYIGQNDMLVLSRATNNITWESRIDVVNKIPNNGGKVRIDEILEANKNFEETEWVNFLDDNLNPYRDLAEGGPERHPHDPLYSEITNASPNSNTLLGLHKIKSTSRNGNNWTNGIPDRSRFIIVQENYTHNNNTLKARKLEVNNNSILSINNQLLLVSNTINLKDKNDEIRLLGNSQLIQTHTDDNWVSGLGKVLIDRTTSVNSIYRYTYMSSPVNTMGENTFKVADILKDGTSSLSETSNIIDINFVNGFNGSATSPISIADYWIYTYGSANGTRSNYVQKRSTGIIQQTDGFLMKGTGVSQNYTFVGKAKDGDITTNVGAEESYLVGNPYASAISAKKFIEDNINTISGTLYFWQHAGEEDIESSNTSGHNFGGYVGGYATRNISMGLAANQVASNNNEENSAPTIGNGEYKAPKNYIAVGQGFFIGGSATGGEVIFNNSQREYITEGEESVFFKNSNRKNILNKNPNNLPIIKLGMDYLDDDDKKLHRQIGISFNKNNSFERDLGYDSDLFDLNGTDIYWKFPNNESKFSIAGVQEISENLEVPLEIVMQYNGEITLAIDEIQNINYDILIKDKLTDSIYNLNNKVKINLVSGVYNERFYLTFKTVKNTEETDTDYDDDIIDITNDLNVFYNSKNNKIVIIKNEDIFLNKVGLYKINGRRIQKWHIKTQQKKTKLKVNKSVRMGFYIVRVQTNKGVVTKKILIK